MYSADLRKHYMLDNPSWKRDIMPEIIEGKNVLDYVDPEIEAKLEALEMEEEALAAAAAIEVRLSINGHDVRTLNPHKYLSKPSCAVSCTLRTKCLTLLCGGMMHMGCSILSTRLYRTGLTVCCMHPSVCLLVDTLILCRPTRWT